MAERIAESRTGPRYQRIQASNPIESFCYFTACFKNHEYNSGVT